MKKIFLLVGIVFIYLFSFSQNVGIGTITPAAKLHIKGSADTSQLVIDANSTQSNTRPLIRLRKSDGSDLMWIHSDTVNSIFIGVDAGKVNLLNGGLGGYSNIFIGNAAGSSNQNGHSNTAIGEKTLYRNLYQQSLVAIGDFALYNNAASANYNYEGEKNTGIGSHALYSNNLGSYNTGVGYYALYNSYGSYNTAIGVEALYAGTSGSQNTATGYHSLYSNTTGSNNAANGHQSLAFNTTGSFNTATGTSSLAQNYGGSNNVATGYKALYTNSVGSFNVANGDECLFSNTTGHNNTATGYVALYYNTTGEQNTAFGDETLVYNTTGSFNTAVGLGALYSTTISANNTMLGCRAGDTYNLGWNNTFVGANSDGNGTDIFNSIVIGESAFATNNNQARIGNSSVTSIGGYTSWTNISDGRIKQNIQENVPGLSFISKLRPVTYNLDLDAADRITQKLPVTDKDGKIIPAAAFETDARKQKEKIVYTGFIAQDVEKAARELGFDFSGVDAAKNDKDLYGLRYAEFVVPLVKAVQEQQKMIEDLQKRILLLEAENKNIRTEKDKKSN